MILDEIEGVTDFGFFEKLMYRFLVIPRTKDAFLETKETWTWTDRNPDWGPGRIDARIRRGAALPVRYTGLVLAAYGARRMPRLDATAPSTYPY